MKFIKLGVISALFFFILLTGISLLLPSSINISKAININAPADSVFAYINDLSKWKKWYASDDNSAIVLSANTVGKGAEITINSTKIVITKTVPSTSISARWQTGSNASLPGEINITSQSSSSQVTVQWLLVQKVKWYPWQKFSLIVSNKTIGPFMEKSLDNLKTLLEIQ